MWLKFDDRLPGKASRKQDSNVFLSLKKMITTIQVTIFNRTIKT